LELTKAVKNPKKERKVIKPVFSRTMRGGNTKLHGGRRKKTIKGIVG